MNKRVKKELEILEAFEREESRLDRKQEDSKFKRDKHVHIFVSGKELYALKDIASSEGISYQSLISNILEKYIEGRLVEKNEKS